MSTAGGAVYDAKLHHSGAMHVSSGGTAEMTVVYNAGSMFISSGGMANRTTIYDGSLRLSSGGVAEYLDVFGGGSAFIDGSASLAYNPWLGDNIEFGENADVRFVAPEYGFYLGNNNAGLVLRETNISDVEVEGGMSALVFDGTVNNVSVNFGGEMYILDIDSVILSLLMPRLLNTKQPKLICIKQKTAALFL